MASLLNYVRDGLSNALTGLGTMIDSRSARRITPNYLDQNTINDAFLGSGMMRKVITVPALDMVREWRDWQADAEQITAIEKEEKRLALRQKVRQAEILRGLGGGAFILGLPGFADQPAPPTIGRGTLAYIHVVNRWQLTLGNLVDDPTDPLHGGPRMFRVSTSSGTKDIHPSRVICFRGDPLPGIVGTNWHDGFWGESRVAAVLSAVLNADEAHESFAALIKDARNIDIGIPQLANYVATKEGEDALAARIRVMVTGQSMFRANLYDAGDPEGKGGEKIDRHQMNWGGIPAIMDAFDQRVAAVSDIPMTRLTGRSPAGMNATGEHDMKNWYAHVGARQELDLRPCLELLDPFLISSALGSVPDNVWWSFAPLGKPSEKEEAERFKTVSEAIKTIQETTTIPERAFAKSTQSTMVENGFMPGLEAALAEEPEETRFGVEAEPGADPADLVTAEEQRRVAANDRRTAGEQGE